MSNTTKGTILTLIAGIAWGLSGTSGQYLMEQGFPVLVLTNIRLLLAGGLLLGYLLLTDREKLKAMLRDRQTLGSILLFALFGLLLNQFSYLKSIYESNAGTALLPVLFLSRLHLLVFLILFLALLLFFLLLQVLLLLSAVYSSLPLLF